MGYNPSNNRFCIMYDDNDTAIKCQFEQPFCYSLSYLLSEVGFGTEEYPYDVQWMLGKSLEEIEARYGPTQDCSIVQSWWSTEPFRRYYVDTNVGLLLYFGKEGVMTYCVEEYRSFPESF